MKRWFKVGGAIAIIAIVIEIAVAVPMSAQLTRLIDWTQHAGVWGVVAYAAAYVTAAVLLIPGSLLTAGAGVAYGAVRGTLLVSPVSVAAATIAFLLGRTVARDWIANKMKADPRFAAIDAAVGQQGLKIVLLLRLSPVFPFNILNYALGLTRVSLRDFVLGSFLGMLPGTFLYVYLGSLVTSVTSLSSAAPPSAAQWALRGAGLAATIAITIVISRIARRALNEQLPPAAGTTTP